MTLINILPLIHAIEFTDGMFKKIWGALKNYWFSMWTMDEKKCENLWIRSILIICVDRRITCIKDDYLSVLTICLCLNYIYIKILIFGIFKCTLRQYFQILLVLRFLYHLRMILWLTFNYSVSIFFENIYVSELKYKLVVFVYITCVLRIILHQWQCDK